MLPDLKIDADGRLTLYMQNESPGAEKESNWLPAPKGAFMVGVTLLLSEGRSARRQVGDTRDPARGLRGRRYCLAEPWPQDIEVAIDQRTFRMLALISHASRDKKNPTGERKKGEAVGKRENIADFVIPLNVDQATSDVPWDLMGTQYIDFSHSWAKGALRRFDEARETGRTANTP